MRIAIVNYVWTPDASTAPATLDCFSTLTGWAGAVAAAGASAVGVFQRFHRDEHLRRDGVDYRFVADAGAARPPTWFGGAPQLHHEIVGWNPDVVHVNGLDYPRLTRALRKRLPSSTAIAVQDHGGFDPASLATLRARWMRRGLAAADALLVASPHQAAQFRDRGLLPRTTRAFEVMESSTTLRVDRRHDADSNGRATRLLWVGRLNANKDPLTVLEGFARFAAVEPSATLTFVYQNGELESAVRARIDRDDLLRRRVTLAGAAEHASLPRFLSAADCFVLGSQHEGSGYAVIEALACGVVPVVTDIPSFRTLTDEGRVGALWPRGDAEALAAALTHVASRPLGPQRMACVDLFDRRFSWPAIGCRAVEIYRELSRA